jgi:hypothetical protein
LGANRRCAFTIHRFLDFGARERLSPVTKV